MTKAIEFAKSLGASISGGINWDWANGFPSEAVAQQFVDYLNRSGRDHRGIYWPQGDETGFSVRFR